VEFADLWLDEFEIAIDTLGWPDRIVTPDP
jgi:hypothetical protein